MLQDWAQQLLILALFLSASPLISLVDAGSLRAAETPAPITSAGSAAAGTEKPPAEAAIRQSLGKKVALWYHEVPLKVVVEDLEQKLGVPVRLDPAALREAGINEETPVTFKMSGLSARAAISLLLREWQMSTITAHETLLITSARTVKSSSLPFRRADKEPVAGQKLIIAFGVCALGDRVPVDGKDLLVAEVVWRRPGDPDFSAG
jgi:hypothetical protein